MTENAPLPGMQTEVVNSTATEVFIGGGRGAGATTAIYFAWNKHRKEVGAKARGLIVFPYHAAARFAFTDNAHRFIDRTAKRFTHDYSFHWDDGSRLSFAYATDHGNAEPFYGRTASFLAFDGAEMYESADVVDEICRYVRDIPHVPYRRIVTGHPPIDPQKPSWLRDRYVDKAPRMERFWRMDASRPGGWIDCQSIPGNIYGNRFLSGEDYDRVIESTFADNALWRAWRNGAWTFGEV